MKATGKTTFEARANRAAAVMAIAACLLAGLVLVGWATGVGWLKSVLPGLIEMKVNTALGLLFAGVAMLAAADGGTPTVARRSVARVSATLVLLIGILTLAEHLMGRNLGIDELLFRDTAFVMPPYFPGRPAPLTAVNFVLLGAALMVLDRGASSRSRVTASEWLVIAVGSTSLFVVLGYAFAMGSFAAPTYQTVAINTAVGFLLLSISALAVRPERALVRRLGSEGAGGALARRFLPVAILVPVVLSWLGNAGQRLGLYSPEYALAIEGASSVLIYCVLVVIAAEILGRLDAERSNSQGQLALFRALIDHSTDAIEVVDPLTTRFLDANERAWSDLGYSRDEFIGLRIADVDPSFDSAAGAHVGQEIERSGTVMFETLHRRKDGSTFPVEVNIARVMLERPYLIVVVRDITQRLASTASLRLQSSALNAAANAIVITDRQGTIQWVNAAATSTTGYTVEELVGRNPRDVFKSGAHGQAFYKNLWDTVPGGRVWRGEMVNRRKDGSRYDEDMTVTPITDADGAVTHFVVIKLDITELKRTEDKLREQAELLDHAQDAILLRDLEHRITYWNKGAERVYGWSAEEAIGRRVSEMGFEDPSAFFEAQRRLLQEGAWTGELASVRKDGSHVLVESRWTLVRDSAGAPSRVLVIDTDITERKLLEQQFLRAQRLESIGTLAGGIAHDLNNVLAPIIMAIDLLKERLPDADSQSLINTIAGSAQRGSDMVRQVLSFARGLEGRRVAVQVRYLVREMEKIARETFPKNIHLVTSARADGWTVLGDPTQLHQVLLNLCINARDAMPGGGEILIQAENDTFSDVDAGRMPEAQAGPYVVLKVKDTGTGMPPEVIDKIFDPFFTTKDVGKGTGLGLSTTLTIVKQHHGFVRVSSEVGRGTEFRVYLPAQPVQGDAPQEADADPVPRGHGQLVLVVDDESAIRELMRQTLDASGYHVLLASDGAEAASLYARRADEIAVVVADLMMPGLDGAALMQVLFKMNPAVKIIAMSGRAGGGEHLPETADGPMRFLPKPFSSDALLEIINDVLTNRNVGDGPRLFE